MAVKVEIFTFQGSHTCRKDIHRSLGNMWEPSKLYIFGIGRIQSGGCPQFSGEKYPIEMGSLLAIYLFSFENPGTHKLGKRTQPVFVATDASHCQNHKESPPQGTDIHMCICYRREERALAEDAP
jgi:hypothetical protein